MSRSVSREANRYTRDLFVLSLVQGMRRFFSEGRRNSRAADSLHLAANRPRQAREKLGLLQKFDLL